LSPLMGFAVIPAYAWIGLPANTRVAVACTGRQR
jgi:hypothetical protein